MTRRPGVVLLALAVLLGAAGCSIEQDLTPIVESRPQAPPLPAEGVPSDQPSSTPRPDRRPDATTSPVGDPTDGPTDGPSDAPTDVSSPDDDATGRPVATPTSASPAAPRPSASTQPSAAPPPSPSPSDDPAGSPSPTPSPTPSGSSGAGANRAPEARPDGAAVDEGTSVTIAVLANDTDPDGDELSIFRVYEPSRGRAEVVGGRVRYTADRGGAGTVTFRYEVTDGGAVDFATVTVEVRDVNDPPVARPDGYSAAPCTSRELRVLANDTDPEGDGMVVAAASAPDHGRAEVAGTVVTYRAPCPADGQAAPTRDRFTYRARDEHGALSEWVTVEVAIG